MARYIVTVPCKGGVETYIAENWNHVGCLIALERIISWEKIAD